MLATNLEFLSDLFLKNPCKNFIFEPILYRDKVYVIDEQRLIAVMSKIEFDSEIKSRMKSHNPSIHRWLSSHKLLNTNFLEEIIRYQINANKIKNLNNYCFFSRDESHRIHLNKEAIKCFVYYSLVHDYISSNISEFNALLSERLDAAEKDLSETKNEKDLKDKREYYKNNFSKQVIDFFLKDKKEVFENISNINLEIKSELSFDDLKLNKTAEIKKFEAGRFIIQKECVKEHLSKKVSIEMGLPREETETYLKPLLSKLDNFTKERLEFEKKRAFDLLEQKEIYTAQKAAQNPIPQFIDKDREIRNELIKNFNGLKKANIVLSDEENHLKSIMLLSAEDQIYSKMTDIFSDHLNLTKTPEFIFKNSNSFDISPTGYCYLDLENKN